MLSFLALEGYGGTNLMLPLRATNSQNEVEIGGEFKQ
jgi:hypothetical protein